MNRHVVLFSWDDAMTKEMEGQFAAELTALAPKITGLRSYHAGPDAGIIESNFDFAVVADFDDADSYLAYRDNAGHQDIIGRLSRPPTSPGHRSSTRSEPDESPNRPVQYEICARGAARMLRTWRSWPRSSRSTLILTMRRC